jgi:hypothetical protein
MPESIEEETTINVTIAIPLRRESVVNATPQIVEERESSAELTIGRKKSVSFEYEAAVTQEPAKMDRRPRKSVPPPVVEIDPVQEGVEKSTGLKITGGSDFNMPITIFHVRMMIRESESVS